MNATAELRRIIEARGPLGINEYMALCLHHPGFGYYATRPGIGAEGDFITAPTISQMFGELLGLWAVEVWRRLGAPDPFLLAEVGPGDGTLMQDMLRAGRVAPEFLKAARVWLIEPSPALQSQQKARLSASGALRWATNVDDLPSDVPLILIGNEVLDCMPARQFVRTEHDWCERVVDVDDAGALRFALRPTPVGGKPEGAVGDIVEHSADQEAFSQSVAQRIIDQGGCALLIDYGRDRPEPGDTLQALHRHAKVDPLALPGESDLTMWADFDIVGGAAESAGAAVDGPVPQGAFLQRLGIEARAAMLARARPDRAATIARQLHRLTAPDEMGDLFKVIAISRPGDPPPPGFAERSA